MFAGLTRKRLPAMHPSVAGNSGVPLVEWWPGHIFVQIHDVLAHDCLVKRALDELGRERVEHITDPGTPDGIALGQIGHIMQNIEAVKMEWAYLSDDLAERMRHVASLGQGLVEWAIAKGTAPPCGGDARFGNCIERAAWAIEKYGVGGIAEANWVTIQRSWIGKTHEEIIALIAVREALL